VALGALLILPFLRLSIATSALCIGCAAANTADLQQLHLELVELLLDIHARSVNTTALNQLHCGEQWVGGWWWWGYQREGGGGGGYQQGIQVAAVAVAAVVAAAAPPAAAAAVVAVVVAAAFTYLVDGLHCLHLLVFAITTACTRITTTFAPRIAISEATTLETTTSTAKPRVHRSIAEPRIAICSCILEGKHLLPALH
jgi:hypothetical protein